MKHLPINDTPNCIPQTDALYRLIVDVLPTMINPNIRSFLELFGNGILLERDTVLKLKTYRCSCARVSDLSGCTRTKSLIQVSLTSVKIKCSGKNVELWIDVQQHSLLLVEMILPCTSC